MIYEFCSPAANPWTRRQACALNADRGEPPRDV
jgi:hypothetical protein